MSRGTLYVSSKELSYLVSLQMSMASSGKGIETWGISSEERKQIGTDQLSVPRNPSDALLLKLARAFVVPRAYEQNKVCECDEEEDIDGKTGDGSGKVRYYPDMGPTGPASVVGKVILELARRLEIELNGDADALIWGAEHNVRADELARKWGWLPVEKPPEEQDG